MHKHLRLHPLTWSTFPSLRQYNDLSRSIGAASYCWKGFLHSTALKKKKKISEMILLDLWNLEMWISASAWLVLTVVNKNNNIIFKLLNYLGIFAWASNSDNIEFSPRTCSWPKYSFIFSGLAFSARGWFELIGFCWLLLVDVEIFSFAFDVPGSVFFTFNLVVKLSRLFDFNRFVGLDIFSSSFSTSAKSTCSFLFFLAESGATGSEMERKYKI